MTSLGAVAPVSSAGSQPQPRDQDTLVQRAEHIPAGKRTPMCAHCNQVIRLVIFFEIFLTVLCTNVDFFLMINENQMKNLKFFISANVLAIFLCTSYN